MKKVLNILLICSILSLSSGTVFAWPKKDKVEKEEKIEIVKPEKTKVNKRLERKKTKNNERVKRESSKEAKVIYETKFPENNSHI